MLKWFLLAVIVFSTVFADLLQSYELRRHGAQTVTARGLGRLLYMIASRRFLLLSIVFMAISFFAFMALLQREPLSFAVPASAATVVCETFLARVILSEAVGKRRMAGALLVMTGVILLAK